MHTGYIVDGVDIRHVYCHDQYFVVSNGRLPGVTPLSQLILVFLFFETVLPETDVSAGQSRHQRECR